MTRISLRGVVVQRVSILEIQTILSIPDQAVGKRIFAEKTGVMQSLLLPNKSMV